MEAAPGIAEFAVIAIVVLFMAFGVLLVVLPFWKICTKAGLPGPLSLLMLVPIANIILPFYVAFTDWPALRNTATPPEGPNSQRSSSGCLMPGIILGVVAFLMISVLGIVAAILLPALNSAREAARRASCANNLKQVGLVYKMFANENEEGMYPELSNEPGRLMFALNPASGAKAVYPEYIADFRILQCPSDITLPDTTAPGVESDPEIMIDDHSYFYLGYAIANENEMSAFAAAYSEVLSEGHDFDQNLQVLPGDGSGGSDTLYRLGDGVERLLSDDFTSAALMASEIPVMIERPDNHLPPGGNVLYLDGHVRFVRYPGEWPMTEQTIGILESLDKL